MPPVLRLAKAAAPVIFSILAFAFAVTSTTSRDWARQNHYDQTLDMKAWDKPVYSAYRSPFIVCGVDSDGGLKDENSNITTTTVDLVCHRFRPFGFGRTSCETVFATQDYDSAVTGDERLCQQVHHAGNLAIASAVFTGLAMLLALVLAVVSVAGLGSARARGGGGGSAEETATTTAAAVEQKDHDTGRNGGVAPVRGSGSAQSWPAFVNFSLVLFALVGAASAFIAQFYGIVGLIQSQPDNGRWAGSPGNTADPTLDNSHGPWVQGRALSVFVTLAWIFNVFAAVAATAVWRLPRLEKLA